MLERALHAPDGYDVGLRIDLASLEPGVQRAVVLAFGASVRRCYAASFETSMSGSDGAALGGRLRLVVDGILDRVRLRGLEELPASQRQF